MYIAIFWCFLSPSSNAGHKPSFGLRLYWDVVDGKISFNLELDASLKQKLQKMSLIHINFEESEVWRVTKDAKITTSGMIGSIGGTLGVFIGFSFLGLLDTFTKWLQYIKRKLGLLKVRRSQKKIMVSSVLPKNELSWVSIEDAQNSEFRSFFGYHKLLLKYTYL